MKMQEKQFMGLPIFTIEHPEHGEMISMNLIIDLMEADHSSVMMGILSVEYFNDGIIFYENDAKEHHYWIAERYFYGWLFFSFPGHPLLSKYSQIARQVISERVKSPIQFQNN